MAREGGGDGVDDVAVLEPVLGRGEQPGGEAGVLPAVSAPGDGAGERAQVIRGRGAARGAPGPRRRIRRWRKRRTTGGGPGGVRGGRAGGSPGWRRGRPRGRGRPCRARRDGSRHVPRRPGRGSPRGDGPIDPEAVRGGLALAGVARQVADEPEFPGIGELAVPSDGDGHDGVRGGDDGEAGDDEAARGPGVEREGTQSEGPGADRVVAGAPRDGGEQLVGGPRRRRPGRAGRELEAGGDAPGEDGGAVAFDHAPLAEGVAPARARHARVRGEPCAS